MGAAVDVQNLSGDKGCIFEIENRVDDLLNLPDATHWMQGCKERMRIDRMHRSPDRPGSDGIHPDTLVRILDSDGPRHCVDPTFGDRRQSRRQALQWLLSQQTGG